MNTEERMHNLFAEALSDNEPDLPDFRPTARAHGRRLRRRHNTMRGVVGLAVAGVVATSGAFAIDHWPESTKATRSGPAEQEPDPPQARLLAALRANLPEGFASIGPDGDGTFVMTTSDGRVVNVGVRAPRPFPYGNLPYSPCEPPAGVPGADWPAVAGTDCERRALPDGTQAVSGHGTGPSVWIVMVSPEGKEITLIALRAAETGAGGASPPTDEQLFRVLSDPEVIAALRGLPDAGHIDAPSGPCVSWIPAEGESAPACPSPAPTRNG